MTTTAAHTAAADTLTLDWSYRPEAARMDAEARDARGTLAALVDELERTGHEVDGITCDRWYHHPSAPKATRVVEVYGSDDEGEVVVRVLQTRRWRNRAAGTTIMQEQVAGTARELERERTSW